MHYLLTGSMTSNFGTYRRSSKVKSSQWPEMMKNIEGMVDKKPERGMMADWLLSSGEAYFGALRSQEARSPTSSYDFNFLSDFFKANPEWFWAGVNGDVLSKIFESEQKTGMAVRLMGGIGVIFSEEQYKKAQENWNDADKFKFAVFMSHDQFRRGGNGTTLEASYKKFFPNIVEQPVEAFTLQEVQQMLHWVKNQNNSYYKKTEETLQLIAYLEKANMMLKIGAPAQETKQATAKRRM